MKEHRELGGDCGKCGHGTMLKKGVLESGNSKYDLFECDACGSEKMKATGVVR
ncbi:hypothetical protein HYV81_06285 [Candidatus Woesearchaeota archaeon]|nr:hypothetical protein [Candidatus Woesearchaeota archaeon]